MLDHYTTGLRRLGSSPGIHKGFPRENQRFPIYLSKGLYDMRRPRFHFPNVSLRRDRLTRFDSLTEAWESWRANFTTTPTVPGRNPSRIHVCPECGKIGRASCRERV